MNTTAIEYRNAQVASALETPEAVSHLVDCPAYGRYVSGHLNAAILHGRHADYHAPTDYIVGQLLLACGFDASGCNLQK